MNKLEEYLKRVSEIRRSGAAVKETSYYGTLETLFNEAGKTLKPKVRCIINIQNRGAGLPDGGFFTTSQFQRQSNELIKGQLPERGCIEVKGSRDDVDRIAETDQVKGYLKKYRQVLVTNLRDFLLVALDEHNSIQKLERYSLATDEKEFWDKADNPTETAEFHEARFTEFLRRVMLYAAPITKPEDVAWFLASYARDAKTRVEQAELDALSLIRNALEESLGIKFKDEKGENFFRSTLVQTLFYGVFSAWVLWHKRNPNTKEKFRWKEAVWELRVPMIKVLFEQIATPTNLKNLNLVEVLDWTGNVLNRVVRDEFFAHFAEEHAVQYFYEPFLQAFDPTLRKELGVWYTPSEIVKYMVERVDRILREELNLDDGLADENVYVLDPACGTGAYLVEVLHRINQTLEEKGEDATRGQKIKNAVRDRIFGFEILPAPFVVSHLQIGLLLEQFGVGLSEDKNERAGVYLTNSLTGWDEHPKRKLPFPEFEDERDLADEIKKEAKILVILGNPPYNAFAGISPEEEHGLVEIYKQGLISEWGIKKFNLDDLYVRFFRLAERRIAETTRKGIVSFISNYSWTSEASFVVMRKKILNEFDKIWIENMHGNRKISEYAPDGKTSETVFAIRGFSPGIQQGVTISTLVRHENHEENQNLAEVYYRDDINEAKAEDRRKHLLQTLDETNFETNYQIANPEVQNRFSLRPSDVSADYQTWFRLNDLCEVLSNGLMEKRGGALIDFDHSNLENRMRKFFDKSISWENFQSLKMGLSKDMARFDAKKTREKVLSNSSFQPERLLRYSLRPFDTRWCYYSEIRPLWNEPRPTLWKHFNDDSLFLLTRFSASKTPEGVPFFLTRNLSDDHFLSPDASAIPFLLRDVEIKENDNQQSFFDSFEDTIKANLSELARQYLENLGFTEIDSDTDVSSLIWYHALAIGYSTDYLAENEDGIRQDFPRIPLPKSKEDLVLSAKLGKYIASLLNTEVGVTGVTVGSVEEPFRKIGMSAHLEGKQFQEDDLLITAGWGRTGKNGITMPSKGKSELRDYRPIESTVIDEETKNYLGEKTYDIYLNDFAYWRNVPEKVWNYYIGGYQVIKKWLSYREFQLLGRALTIEELTEVTHMIRRISAILLLEPELNKNYQKIKTNSFNF